MNTIFIGGSRHVSRLPAEVKKRLDNVIASHHQVIVGDANGADKAVQKHFFDANYANVTVFCSGDAPRNNLGSWTTHRVDVPKGTKGFQFYAAKDREMAREADFGLMIWDGKSPGTVLNVLRLVQAGKISVLFNVPDKAAVNVKTVEQYRDFIRQCDPSFRADLRDRATPQEWALIEVHPQPSLLDHTPSTPGEVADMPDQRSTPPAEEAVRTLNAALASGDATRIMNVLGAIARDRGMSQIARETGLARESLYRSLDAGGNPEFVTVMKVLSSLGVRLEAKPHDLSPVPNAAVL
ncbi:adenine-specific DNA-methyltransferase [Agrobacterium vitis]|jgi:probable addiction module antidote protein|nr:adenine-specific DNA-methyltransferase [Agrobacterium vitis]MBE1440221.1 adenine-specific DNA-methyltransferase [Agrobacterium vitis]